MHVKKTKLIEFECVVRGYLAGSAWKEYQEHQTVSDILLPKGLRLADPLPVPIFTPAKKALSGHDENISFKELVNQLGLDIANYLKNTSIALYEYAAKTVEKNGLILADTKFEFGYLNDQIILIDEALTPDSSRYWDKENYKPGIAPHGFDKQIIRDYLETCGWDKNSVPPLLPDNIIQEAALRYRKIIERLGI
jgi:phosphoribosylaminoimidazole-succinocarboxamide synthase